MNLEQEYRRLEGRLRAIAWSVCKDTNEIDDYVGEAALLLMKAAGNASFDPSILSWDAYVGLVVQNGLKDVRRQTQRRRAILRPVPLSYLENREAAGDGMPTMEADGELDLGVGPDARALAREILAQYGQGVRGALDRARMWCFQTIGWTRYWIALEELRTALGN